MGYYEMLICAFHKSKRTFLPYYIRVSIKELIFVSFNFF